MDKEEEEEKNDEKDDKENKEENKETNKEEDIPKEAYGEKEIYEEDSSKEKESGKNNAYILFYRKIDFDQSHIDKKMKNELALPPYSKYSNINEELKKEINYKLYKNKKYSELIISKFCNIIN